MSVPKITFIGAGSTAPVKNILGDMFHREVLRTAHIALMDTDSTRLGESHIVVRKLMDSTGANGKITCHTQQKETLKDTDFVVVASQIGGYGPCTAADFEVCKRRGLEQTVTDTLGPGGIMHVLRTIPHLWQVCENMTEVYPDATMFNYANPMAMGTWTMYARYPHIKWIGLCHSVQGTTEELVRDLNIDPTTLRYRCAGINHMASYLELERKTADGSYVDPCPELLMTYEVGQAPKPNIHGSTRCQNTVRYGMFKELSYFVTEPPEHFVEYTPWFIKSGREDLIECYKVPLDKYLKHYVEQLASRHKEPEEYEKASRTDIRPSREYTSAIMDAIWTGEPSVVYGDVHNDGLISDLPQGCCVEVACLTDANGIQPTKVDTLPLHLAALMQTNINVQTLLTEAIPTGNRDRIYHAVIMDPHTAAMPGADEIYALVDDLTATHGDWPPGWLHH